MNQRDSEELHGWSLMLSTAFWNFGGFDSASTFAGEVHDPARTYPKALLASLVLITASLVIPLFAVTISSGSYADSPPYREWSDGTYVDLAWRIGGEPLQLMVAISGMASQIAMFTTEMFVCSHLLIGMSQQRLAPRYLRGRDPTSGAPVVAVAFMFGVVLTGFTVLDRYALLVMNNTFAGAAVLLELAAAVTMRSKFATHHPQRQVAFRAPCRSRLSLALSLLPAVIISMVVVTPALIMSDVNCAVTTSLLVAFGWLSFRIWPE
jgi:amino acid transporter